MGTRLVYHLIFFVLIGLYGASLFFKFFAPNDTFLNNYLADLVCMPIVLYVTREVIRIIKKQPGFKLSNIKILVGFLYFSLLFEFILPEFNSKYTSDLLDVLMYFLGSSAFYFIQSFFHKKARF